MSQDAMWSGYTDQSFPGNQVMPYGDSLGKLKKDVRDERSGATMSQSHCLLSFVFFPAFPIILPECIVGNAFHHWHSRRFLGTQNFFFFNFIDLCFKLVRYSHWIKSL